MLRIQSLWQQLSKSSSKIFGQQLSATSSIIVSDQQFRFVSSDGKISRIKVERPIVEMDGDEMTRVIWEKIKEKVRIHYYYYSKKQNKLIVTKIKNFAILK